MDAGKAAIIGAAVSAVGAIVVAIIGTSAGVVHFGKADPNLRFPVAVLDSGSGNAGIPDAEVTCPRCFYQS